MKSLCLPKKNEYFKYADFRKNRNTLKMQVRSQHGTVMDVLYFGDIEQILTYIMQKYGESETEKCFQGQENAVTLSFIYYPSVNEYRGR